MPQNPKVLVVDRRGNLASELAKAADSLSEPCEILRLARSTRVVDAVDETRPDVLIAAPEELTHAGMRRLARVHRANPRLVILLSPNGQRVPVSEAAACGVSDVLPYPSTPARMRTKIRRALEVARTLKPEPAEPAPAPSPEPERPTTSCNVVTITSATGGCGKTFYATNIAAYVARATGGSVLLVDLDLQFGEVAVALHLRPERTVADLVDSEDMREDLPDHVVRHDAGYDVLCAPPDPVVAERVGPRETAAVLDACVASYDHVIVDTPPALNEVVLAAFDRSQALVVMATLDVPSLKNLRVFLKTLDRLKIPTDDVSLVLNKAEDGTGIDVKEVERLYPQGFSSVLPYAKEVTRSLNVGQPVLVTDPGAEISTRFVEGVRALVSPADGAELPWERTSERRGRGFWSWIWKGAKR